MKKSDKKKLLNDFINPAFLQECYNNVEVSNQEFWSARQKRINELKNELKCLKMAII